MASIFIIGCNHPISNNIWNRENNEYDHEDKNTFLIMFLANYDGAKPSVYNSIDIKEGEKIIRPDDPMRAGYTFLNWFSESKGYIPYDFEAEVFKNTTLYARWNNQVTVNSQDVSPDLLFNTIFTTENEGGYHRTYRSRNGSVLQFRQTYNGSSELTRREIEYQIIPSAPVSISVGNKSYIAEQLIVFYINLAGNDLFNITPVSGNGKLVLKENNNNNVPVFDRRSFSAVETLNDSTIISEIGGIESYLVETNEWSSLITSMDLQGIRQFEIINYSADVITLDGFGAGTYYYVGDDPISL
jgi:hypothetical protein